MKNIIIFVSMISFVVLTGMDNKEDKKQDIKFRSSTNASTISPGFLFLFPLTLSTMVRASETEEKICSHKECNFKSSLYCQFSLEEGLCDSCEFKQYPEQFSACVFCRTPNHTYNKLNVSANYCCEWNLTRFLVKKLETTPLENHYFIQGVSLAIQQINKTVAKNFITGLKVSEMRSQVFKNKEFNIYYGAVQQDNKKIHVWVDDIALEEKDRKPITSIECKDYVLDICQKYNLYGHETGHNIKEFPQNVSAMYEEIIN